MAATKVRQMERERLVRSFAKRGDATEVPDLWQVQQAAYSRFLQVEENPEERETKYGLESLLREIFPIESYDETMKLEYVSYSLDEPRSTQHASSQSVVHGSSLK